MASMDFAASANGGVVVVGSSYNNYVTVQNPANLNDGNDGSFCKIYIPSKEICLGIDLVINLGPAHIDEFSFKYYANDGGVRDPWMWMGYQTYDGVWHLLEYHNPIPDGNYTKTFTNGGAGFEDVIAMKAVPVVKRDNRFFLWDLYSVVQIYHMKATGENTDSGLRVRKGSTTYKIASEVLVETEHKLRVRKGSTTMGIPLVKTTSPLAVPIRIAVAEDEILCPRKFVE